MSKELFFTCYPVILDFIENGTHLPRDEDVICALCTFLYNYKNTSLAREAIKRNSHFKNLVSYNRPWERRYSDLKHCKKEARLVAAKLISEKTPK